MLKCNSKTGNANMYDYAFMISLFIWSSLAWKGFGAIEKARSYHYNVEVQRKQQTRIDMTENIYHLQYEVGKIEIIPYYCQSWIYLYYTYFIFCILCILNVLDRGFHVIFLVSWQARIFERIILTHEKPLNESRRTVKQTYAFMLKQISFAS